MARFNREDSRTVLPQLEKELREHETETKELKEELQGLKNKIAELTKGAYTATVSDFFTFNSGWSLSGDFYAMRREHTIMFRMNVKSSSDISVPASGDITNITIGTVKSGWRPPFMVNWTSMAGAFATGYITATGTLIMGFCEGTGTARTISAGTVFYISCVYITENI